MGERLRGAYRGGLNGQLGSGFHAKRLAPAEREGAAEHRELPVFAAVSSAFKTPCSPAATVTSGSCTAASDYWSSTTFASGPVFAWFVGFFNGDVDVVGKGVQPRAGGAWRLVVDHWVICSWIFDRGSGGHSPPAFRGLWRNPSTCRSTSGATTCACTSSRWCGVSPVTTSTRSARISGTGRAGCLKLVVRANARRDKAPVLLELREELEELKVRLRLCQDVKAFPNLNAFEHAIAQVVVEKQHRAGLRDTPPVAAFLPCIHHRTGSHDRRVARASGASSLAVGECTKPLTHP